MADECGLTLERESISRPPLQGIRVVDFTHVFSLPYTAGIMADMGAEVIKVEGPARPDTTRTSMAGSFPDNKLGGDWWDRCATYNLLNRGKLSLTLDLNTDRGKELFRELVSVSDVVLENFAPRVMRRWGLDYTSLRRVKPDIIMVSNSGYGHGDGPYSEYPAQATTMEGTHGLCWVTGYPGGPPSKAGASYVDFIAAWSALFAIGAALRHRLRTGQGQWVDLSMYQAGVMGISESLMDYMANGRLGQRIGNRHPYRAPQGCYRTRGDDRWIVLSVGSDRQWQDLCWLMESPGLATDPRFDTLLSRLSNQDELDEIINGWAEGLDGYELMENLQSAGIPAAPVLDARDLHMDPHFKARGFLEMVEYPEEREIGDRPIIGRPYKFSKSPMGIKEPAPAFGQHNHRVLVELLGVAEAEYESFAQEGAIATAPQAGDPPPSLPVEELASTGLLGGWDPNYKAELGIG